MNEVYRSGTRRVPIVLVLLGMIVAMLADAPPALAGATFTAVQDGDWDDPATWGGTAPTNTVPAGDEVIIPAGISVDVSGALNIDVYGTVTNRGSLRVPIGSEMDIRTRGALVNEGTLRIPVRGWVTVSNGTLDNYGVIEVLRYQARVGQLRVIRGTLTNHFGAYVDIGGTFVIGWSGGNVVNYGTLDINVDSPFRSGLMVVYGGSRLDNYGLVVIDKQLRTQDGPTGVIYNHPGATIVNNDLLNVGPGLLVNDSLISNHDQLTNEEGGQIHQLCSGSITGNAVIGTPPVDACDTTPPVVTALVTGTLGNAGWYTGFVEVGWDVSDPDGMLLSQVGCGTTYVGADTSGTTVDCTATSYGGSTTTGVTIKKDSVPPAVTGSASPEPNTYGWNSEDVTVSFSGSDGLSGVASCDAATTLNTDGAGQSVFGSCVDVAGNVGGATASGINIDTAPPIIGFTGNAGTYDLGDTVAIVCTATDALSGIESSTCPSVSSPAYLFDHTAPNVLAATAQDFAGNVADASTSFEVEVTQDGIDAVIDAVVDKPAVAGKLQKQLDRVLDADPNDQPKELGRLENLLEKHVRKGNLTQEAADDLLEYTTLLLG